jgi:hypothetical protein
VDGSSKSLNIGQRLLVQANPLPFDPQVQIQRMVIKAFGTFDAFQHACEDQTPLEDPPLENNVSHVVAPHDEVLMEASFTEATTHYSMGVLQA